MKVVRRLAATVFLSVAFVLGVGAFLFDLLAYAVWRDGLRLRVEVKWDNAGKDTGPVLDNSVGAGTRPRG